MDSAERRARHKQQVRARILDAARELLLAEGVDGFSMRKLAARIGYTPTGIYFHFPDRQAILRELTVHDFRTFHAAVSALAGEPDPIERIRGMSRAYLDFGLQHPNQYRLLFMTPAVTSWLLEGAIEQGNPAEDAYALILATASFALEKGCFRPAYQDPAQVAQMIWAALHGVVSLAITKGHDEWFDLWLTRETGEAVLEALLHGLMPGDTSPRPSPGPSPRRSPRRRKS